MTDQEFHALAHELLEYKDGDLYWKKNRGGTALANTKAGSLHPSMPYKTLSIMDKKYFQHRIIF